MPEWYVALLRGINVGRGNRVSMADLRDLFAELGCSGVSTLLNSGNVIFTAPGTGPAEMASRIEAALAARLGLSVRVIVVSAAELATAFNENPLLGAASDPSRLFVSFLGPSADRRLLEPLLQQDWSPEILALGGRVAYMWCPAGSIESRLAPAAAKVLGETVTTRNWATVLKLHTLLNSGEPQP